MIFFQRLLILLVYISGTFTIDLFVRSTSQHLNNSSYFRLAFQQFMPSFLFDQVGFHESASSTVADLQPYLHA